VRIDLNNLKTDFSNKECFGLQPWKRNCGKMVKSRGKNRKRKILRLIYIILIFCNKKDCKKLAKIDLIYKLKKIA